MQTLLGVATLPAKLTGACDMTVEQMIKQCRKAQQDFKAQDKKMRKPTDMGSFNWRCVPKTDRLHKTWKHLEASLLKEIYKQPHG